jgi:hypothetical protein
LKSLILIKNLEDYKRHFIMSIYILYGFDNERCESTII